MDNETNNDSSILEQLRHKALITLSIKKKGWKKQYTLRARIGIRISQILGIVEVIFKD